MEDPPELFTARRGRVGEDVVERLLPNRGRRMVGPYCFLDLFSPHARGGGGVGPHPHTGIQTATWLTSGTLVHRDSLGSLVAVRPGSLSLMTAGAGIAHAEEPDSPAAPPPSGAQLWIALPDAARGASPSYDLVEDLPVLDEPTWRVVVFAGELGEARAPSPTFWPMVGVEIRLAPRSSLVLPLTVDFEHGCVALEGTARLSGVPITRGSFGFTPRGRRELRLESEPGATLLLLGGEPFTEELLMWWNFVGRSAEEIAAWRGDWAAGRRFGEVPNSVLGRVEAPPLPALLMKPRPGVERR